MSDSQFSTPIQIKDDSAMLLERIPLSGSDSTYNEAFIQDLAFKYPSCLPVREIDRTYEDLIPVCTELHTPAGPLDALYVTPKGKLVIVEAKLWRNPEARRKVIGQILDYAKEISRWDYEDLQREVSRVTGRKGNALYEIARSYDATISESEFVDEVAKSLSLGRFLLLIIGDGIREGVGAIAEYLEEVGALEFTLGLVELALYKSEEGMLVQPRILAKTAIFKRHVVTLRSDASIAVDEDECNQKEDKELTDLEKFYQSFWSEFLPELKLDDVSQPIPRGKSVGNIFFAMPPSGGQAWLSVYFLKNKNMIGMFLTFTRRSAFGDYAYQALIEERDVIEDELGFEVLWQTKDGKHSIAVRNTSFPNIYSGSCRSDIKQYFSETINRFVNVFRPRLEKLAKSFN